MRLVVWKSGEMQAPKLKVWGDFVCAFEPKRGLFSAKTSGGEVIYECHAVEWANESEPGVVAVMEK